jgi:heme a synthase
MPKLLRLLSVVTTAIMAVVLLQGALVTNTGSGQGCGSTWPLCDGEWFPAMNLHSWIEYSHRAVSGLAGILVLIMAVWAWRALGRSREAAWLAVASVFFIGVQAALGAAAVVWPQPKAILALHFGISLVSFASVFLLAVLVFQRGRQQAAPPPPGPFFRLWSLLLFAYAYLVVYLGAFVRHSGASLACTDWPLCNGAVIPELTGLVGAHFMHRVAAGLLVLLLGWFAWKVRAERPDLARAAAVSFALVVLQALSGATVVLSGLSLGSQTLHGGLIIILFASLSYMLWQAYPLGRLLPGPAAAGQP